MSPIKVGITTDRPTLSEVAVSFERLFGNLVSPAAVASAARTRGITPCDGRVPTHGLLAIYSTLRARTLVTLDEFEELMRR